MTTPPAKTEKCGAKARSGKPCGRPAGWGTDHVGAGTCKLHGGCTPSGAQAGALELGAKEARAMGIPRDVDPHEAMLQCISIAAGHLDYATKKVAELEDPLVTTMFGPALNIWVEVQQRAMDRLVLYSKTALAAGVEERRVRVAEQQGALFAEAIRGILMELGVADRPEVPGVVRRHLTLVAAPAA